jgi:hypothetical protein
MTSPSETAHAHQAGPADDQNMPELSRDPASTIPEGDPRSPAPAASGYPGAEPGSAPQCPWPGTAQAGAHAGKQSSRCSSMIRVHLSSWRPVWSRTASSRSSCPSRSSSIHCCLPGRAMMREPRNCARHSGGTAHSGTVSRISPVKPDHLPLTAVSLSTWPAQMPAWVPRSRAPGAVSLARCPACWPSEDVPNGDQA